MLCDAVRDFKLCSYPDDIQLHAMQVMFHPTQQNKLLSASVDGLVAVFDLANGLDEDDGFMVSYILRLLMSWPISHAVYACHTMKTPKWSTTSYQNLYNLQCTAARCHHDKSMA